MRAKAVVTPLSSDQVSKTNAWLEDNKSLIPEPILLNIIVALKCCSAIDALKFKIKDMIVLLSQHMGLSSKSEKESRSQHGRRIF